jgi:REP element-mobilizing transposase RayT
MSRPLRIQYPDAWYHLMNRGRRGETVFSGKEDYYVFIHLLKEAVCMYNVKIAAYCLMSNHYHLLIQTPDGNLARCMRHLNGVYAQRYNRSHHCEGQLFRGRCRSILVEADSYLLELVRYIHRNPLEAGIVDNLDKYCWSSHRGYLSNSKKWSWLHKNFILSFFSKENDKKIKKYEEFVSVETPEKINKILAGRKLPSVLGSEIFINNVKEKFFDRKMYEEIPDSRSLAPDVEKIQEMVCNAYHVTKSDLLLSRRGLLNEPRNVAIYLLRRIKGERLKEIGREFGIKKYSSVSSIIERMKNEISKSRDLKVLVERLEDGLIKSQGQTRPYGDTI